MRVILVTFDGRILLPGKDNDYVFDQDGKPVISGQRFHEDTVVQVIDVSQGTRDVYFGYDCAEKLSDADLIASEEEGEGCG